MERLREALRESGLKLTHQRMEVFREVATARDHPDAETVFKRVKKRIPAISLDTVYRNLWMLNDIGLINTLGPQRGRARFDDATNPHHHFICSRCGGIHDFHSRDFDDLGVPEQVRNMGEVATVHVQIWGICSECAYEN